ncbi:hypothetical protein HZA43_01910 [Candidatus Peregrinibacteria bacterium]|nr:hypothetical protein [Candidatus Peregrinibacteria bacterium]
MHELEFRRQILHTIYGFVLVILHFYGFLPLPLLFLIILGGALTSWLVLKKKASFVERLLRIFEREHHLLNFPGRGMLFFTIGSFLVLWIFEKTPETAYAGILILSVGDSLTNVVGRQWGRIKTRLNPHKYLEGTLVGILGCLPIAYYFSHNIFAALATACVAMFLEIPNIRIFGFEIDDNLIIPLGASITLSFFT